MRLLELGQPLEQLASIVQTFHSVLWLLNQLVREEYLATMSPNAQKMAHIAPCNAMAALGTAGVQA